MTTGRTSQGLFADPIRKHIETARSQISQGQLKQAAQTLNQAQRILPGDARLFMLAALMAEKSGNKAGAFDAMRRCVNVAPNWGPGLLEMALLHARHNQFEPAIEAAEKVAALEPNNLQVLAGVIDIAHRAGAAEMAIKHLRRGLTLVPNDMELRRMLAQDLSLLGQHEEALTLWNGLVADNPGNQYALEGRLQALQSAGLTTSQQAQADADALLALQPDNAVYAYWQQLTQGQTPTQQPVEITGFGELALRPAVGARHLGQTYGGATLPLFERIEQLVGAEPLVAGAALGQWVDERIDMAGGLPDLGRQDDRGVQADHVVAPPHHRLPPLTADVLFEFDTQGTVVPRRAGAPVDLAGREHEPAPLAQVDDGFYSIGHEN